MFTVALLRYFYVCDVTIVFRKERWLHFLKKDFFYISSRSRTYLVLLLISLRLLSFVELSYFVRFYFREFRENKRSKDSKFCKSLT